MFIMATLICLTFFFPIHTFIMSGSFMDIAVIIGSLRNYDGDDNENGKKQQVYISKTTILHVHHAFFVRFFAVVARLRRENAQFHVFSRTGTQDNNFLFLFLNFDTVF